MQILHIMKTNTIYIFILSLLLLMSSLFLMWYVRGQIAHKIEAIQAYRVKESENNTFEVSKKLKEEMNILEQQEEIIKETFLETNEIVSFITQFESNAESRGLTIVVQKVEYGAPEVLEQKYSIKPILFSVELTGSFGEIESFVSYIKASEKKLGIKELKIYKLSRGDVSEYTAHIIIEGITLSYE